MSSTLPPLGGVEGSAEPRDCSLLCAVCFELIEEAYVTRCGHSFCYACIAKSVELHRRCPKCGASLPTREHIFPNFLLNELVEARRQALAAVPPTAPPAGRPPALQAALSRGATALPLADVEYMIALLTRRKRALQAQSSLSQQRLLLEFLQQLHRQRTQQLVQLQREASLVQQDMEYVANIVRELGETGADSPGADSPGATGADIMEPGCSGDGAIVPHEGAESFALEPPGGAGGEDALAARWRRLQEHFDDFVQCYFSHRSTELYFPSTDCPSPPPATAAPLETPPPSVMSQPTADTPDARVPTAGDAIQATPLSSPPLRTSPPPPGLTAFARDLHAFTRYHALRPLATLHYCSDAINYSTIVSTIEFDKDKEFLAIAGVTKRIKVFELAAVLRDAVDVHYPCAEMQCAHKVSSVSWNKYHKAVLASADYEGTVSLWDAHTGQRTRALQEHDKRCWSVHFNRCDVRLLASGSDDARVKLWALNADRAVHTLEAKFNVCTVRFNPRSSCHLAFGSADHCVHYYDLRSPRQPLAVLKDHRKAVSYVKFLDQHTLVSASTDSQLKLWNVDSPRPQRSFTGHTNEKNFVGLATDGQYIACGSENNALYVYYKGLAKPLLAYRFEASRGLLERERRDDEPAEFVSAVCWRRGGVGGAAGAGGCDRPLILAANSQGTIKVLELL